MRTASDQQAFREWLTEVGNGCSCDPENPTKLVRSATLFPNAKMFADNLDNLIDFCFPPSLFTNPIENARVIADAGILCPINKDVQRINDIALSRMTGETVTYASIDEPIDNGELLSKDRFDFNLEAVHNELPTGVPPHLLRLKVLRWVDGCLSYNWHFRLELL